MEMVLRYAAIALTILECVFISRAQDANCDYQQNIANGVTYYVHSPGYPNYYTSGVTCRWRATCPVGTVCHLICSEISIPASSNCANDRMLISRTGDSTLQGADRYCGAGTLDVTSVDNLLSIGFLSAYSSSGGRFYCTLVSQPKTVNNSTNNCSCGWKKNTKIVGGQETAINEFPMMVALVDVSSATVSCGGTIISPWYVMTAAHCVDYQHTTNVAILVGAHNIKIFTDSPATKIIKSNKFIIHPNFNRNKNYDYDIALVKGETIITFSQLVGPACLPFKYSTNNFAGQYVQALGWGSTYLAGPDSNYLQKVSLKVISQAVCKNSLQNYLTDRQMCTFEDGKDSCQNDSGGPLLWQDPNTYLIYHVGIISFGQDCATLVPGVSTRVSMFLDWIIANTPGESYCYK